MFLFPCAQAHAALFSTPAILPFDVKRRGPQSSGPVSARRISGSLLICPFWGGGGRRDITDCWEVKLKLWSTVGTVEGGVGAVQTQSPQRTAGLLLL